MEIFTLTEQHIELLQNANVIWNADATGAPAIDPKRPYGNSNVPGDVAEILEYESPEDSDAKQDLLDIHEETKVALQIILTLKTFQPGNFKKVDQYGDMVWERIV